MLTKEDKKFLQREDSSYITDVTAATLYGAPRKMHLVMWLAFFFVVYAVVWASNATLDEVTRGSGKVIPSSQIQVVQNLEGGILSDILVKEGDFVEKGQVLLRLDDVRFASAHNETKLKYYELLAKMARLTAEVEGKPMDIPDEVERKAPSHGRSARQLYDSRQNELQAVIDVLEQQARQKRQELSELRVKQAQITTSLDLVRQELDMSQPLVAEGAFSEVEILRLKRTINDLQGELNAMVYSLPRLESSIKEVEEKIREQRLRFKTEALAELNEARAEFERTVESLRALEDRVQRTHVVSPVKGTVKKMNVTTIGGVVQPGMDLVEIVPKEDQLVVEAKVRPKDIAFLHPGQPAIVKFTAYDFSIYGGLPARLQHISADAIEDKEKGKEETFYLIRVVTDKNYLIHKGEKLGIIPGMVAEVDILTGKKTVLNYMLKPILKAKDRALRER